tara:strand:+ start:469 stop:1095 length:627 start_codon:yes stop_codon:yes gene_type:complete
MSTIKTNQLAHTANGASVYTLPQTDGSAGQVLTTNGSGVLSWANDSAGKILQVQQTHYSDLLSNSTASGGEWAPSQLNCSITPSATSSDVLITAKIAVGCEINTRRVFMKVYRDSTEIAKGDAAGNVSGSYSRAASVVDIRASDVVADIVFSFLDTGISTTSATTYSFRFFHSQTASMNLYINRAHTITDRFQDAFISSNVILQEVAG